MTHEKNMLDFVIEQKKILKKRAGKATNNSWRIQHSVDCEHQVIFLASAPKLGDFVPTNEKGEVMEEPFDFGNWKKAHYPSLKRMKIHEQFQEALDRVMWKGWEVKQSLKKDHYILYHPSDPHIARCCDNKMEWIGDDSNTYNELITSGVKLERIQKK